MQGYNGDSGKIGSPGAKGIMVFTNEIVIIDLSLRYCVSV